MSPSDALDAVASGLLGPLDALRAGALRVFGRRLGPWFGDRPARTTALGLLSVLVAFLISTRAPLLTLALGPILLGVPHLLADVRYLVLRRGLDRDRSAVAFVLAPLALAFWLPTFELIALVTLGAALASRGSTARRLVLAAAALGFFAIGRGTGHPADVVLGHLHNVVAVGLWWTMRPGRRGYEASVPVAIVAGVLLCVVAAPAITSNYASFAVFGHALPVDALVASLVPTANPSIDVGFPWILVFAFGQAVHYALWLRLVPEDARTRRSPRSFRSSFRALRAELGSVLLLTGFALAVGVAAWASVDLIAARDGYLRLALFHAPLEIALMGLAWSEARRP